MADDDDSEKEDEIVMTEEEVAAEAAKRKARSGGGRGRRRCSVSAECGALVKGGTKWVRPVHAKSQEDTDAISSCISDNFLFSSLDKDSRLRVIEAMFAKEVPADSKVITQGEEGDFLYIVKEGSLKVFVNGNAESVLDYGAGAHFGELALMYNCPRAATVQSVTACKLWALDRLTFHHMLASDQNEKRQKYEEFLRGCELFKTMESSEVSRLADVLEEVIFEEGEAIIEQDFRKPAELEANDEFTKMKFFLVFKGQAAAFQKVAEEEVKVKDYAAGSGTEGAARRDGARDGRIVDRGIARRCRFRALARTSKASVWKWARDLLARAELGYSEASALAAESVAAGSGTNAARNLSTGSADAAADSAGDNSAAEGCNSTES